ncbi:MAG: regulatory protein RecX [Betaproteobacteria bacterium]|nr:regulatory protein RecX [Betaproteobacteria bacterium]
MVRQHPSLRAKALALLATREYSRQELARKLSEHARKIAPDSDADSGAQRVTSAARAEQVNQSTQATQATQADIDLLLDEFVERGWLSEARYVEQAARRLSRRYGPRRVAQDLAAKGMSRESVAASLPYLHSEAVGTARALLERKFRESPQTFADRARRVRFLLGRGFDYDVIRNVLKGQHIPESDDES